MILAGNLVKSVSFGMLKLNRNWRCRSEVWSWIWGNIEEKIESQWFQHSSICFTTMVTETYKKRDHSGCTRWCPTENKCRESYKVVPVISPTKIIVIGVNWTNLANELGHHLVWCHWPVRWIHRIPVYHRDIGVIYTTIAILPTCSMYGIFS